MPVTETVVQGTLKPDGTLELDDKPNLPAGRVTVVLRPVSPASAVSEATPTSEDPFWQRMRAMWAIPVAAAAAADGGGNTLAEVRKMRQEWDEHQEAIERHQDEGRTTGEPNGESRP